ncbi:MAG: sensor histidine kinase [Planctomycetaceae bacterium]
MAPAKAPPGSRPSTLDAFFGGVPKTAGVVLGSGFVILLGVVGGITGDVSLAPFTVLPVALVTWNAGRRWGLAVAALAALMTHAALRIGGDLSGGLLSWWNAVVWFGVLAFVVWLLGALQDAAARQARRLEAETERSDDLRTQNEIKNTLLHAVSHDLKGPLAGVLGAMQTIRRAEQIGLTADQREELYTVIEQSGAKAARLVDDLLDLDRLGRGQLRPERRFTDVVALAERAVEEVPALSGHPIVVAGPHVLADVDGAKVERIVENLLVNAGRHTPDGTPVRVSVERSRRGIVLVVEDEGPGVPDDLKEHVFDAFRQGEHSHGGVGIGLSLVQRFAELHEGTARVEDREGGGARFVVELPAEVRTEAPRARAG